MKKFTLILILLLFPASVFAGEYVLVKGKGVEVCEAYGKNLNSLNPPLAYTQLERKLNPEFKNFSKPEWGKMYPEHEESEKLFPKINLFLWERDANPIYHFPVTEYKKWRNTPKQRDAAWESYKAHRQKLLAVGLPIARADIDNDGKIENIALDSVNNNILLVLNDDKSDIDLQKTTLVLQHPSRKTEGKGELTVGGRRVEDAMHKLHYGVFIYKHKTYFDIFVELEVGKFDWVKKKLEEIPPNAIWGNLRVFITENQKMQEICTYNYR